MHNTFVCAAQASVSCSLQAAMRRSSTCVCGDSLFYLHQLAIRALSYQPYVLLPFAQWACSTIHMQS